MKKLPIFLALSLVCILSNAQQTPQNEHAGHNHGQATTTKPVLQQDNLVVKETEFDFGSIPQGKPVYHIFILENKGKTELRLDNVTASCGCTTPEWSRDPIPAGGTAQVKVGYNSAAEGTFAKPVSIIYNTNQTKQLIIKGNVWRAPDGPAPANASIDILKKQTF
ncbi:MAG: DUF1573 domain-containing protein [Chitinophagaceae bacterium]|nr:DUF1573 domain-containing protein [Chitinophagaceae bacterium]